MQQKLSASNISNDNLETLKPAFNISQMHDKLCCGFWRVGNVLFMTTHTRGCSDPACNLVRPRT